MSLRALALVCFFLSGATGLLYQVLWTRLLGSTIGNTHFSITVVVSVFMGGLALGSWLGGKVADRTKNPLRLYGILNLGGALLCLAVPPATSLGQPLFEWLYQSHPGEPEALPLLVARIAFSALLIIGPTTCMGATLPVLARYFTTKMDDVGFSVGRLYTVNTFGAVVGVFLAGFWAMEHLGVWGTTTIAVSIDVVIGLLVIAASKGIELETIAPPSIEESKARARVPRDIRLAVFAFGATGFANMLLQIAWTKAIIQTIGNSTYAFSLIVTLFILGIGVGGAFTTFFVDRIKRLNLALGVVVAVTAVFVSLTVPLLGRFPIWGARWFDSVGQPDFDVFLRIKMGMVAMVILPCTILMGAVFPLVGKIRTLAVERVGSAVGESYFSNTAGAILGTLAAGFLFIPWFGKIYWTLYLGAALSLAIALLLISTAPGVAKSRRLLTSAVFAMLVLVPGFVLRPFGVLGSESSLWDPAVLSKGAYVYFQGSYYLDRKNGTVLPTEDLIKAIRAGNKVESYKEGIHAPVAVVSNPKKGLAMRISGKVEASIPTSGGYNRDMPHQIMAGHLPMILHPDPKEVLTLGLGGGVTLGTLTLYPIDNVDSLEISQEVIEAARDYFGEANRGALGDTPLRPVRNIVGDGRNHLLYTPKRYDVITSVPSNPWIAGIGTLFTTEFFEICRDRLRPNGIICNWIHKINMNAEDIRTVFRTFVGVFGEHVQLWDLGYDCLLIGSNDPINLDLGRLEELLKNPEVHKDLGSLGITDANSFLRHYRWNRNSLFQFVGGTDGVKNTDANPILEFSCPRGLYGYTLHAYENIAKIPFSPVDSSWLSGGSTLDLENVRTVRSAFGKYQNAHVIVSRFERLLYAKVNAGGDASFGVDPATGQRVSLKPSAAESQQIQKDYQAVLELFEGLSRDLHQLDDAWFAERVLVRAKHAFGGAGDSLANLLGDHYLVMAGQQTEAAAKLPILEKALQIGAGRRVLGSLTQLYLQLNQAQRGVTQLRPVLDAHANDPAVVDTYAVLLGAAGQLGLAESLFRQALQMNNTPAGKSTIHGNLGFCLLQAGRRDEATVELETALRLNPQNRQAKNHLDVLRSRTK